MEEDVFGTVATERGTALHPASLTFVGLVAGATGEPNIELEDAVERPVIGTRSAVTSCCMHALVEGIIAWGIEEPDATG
jgi:hypothetical protein